MQAIVQYKDGDMDTIIGSGRGREMIASILKNWMYACQDDKRNLQHPPETIWIVLDELGEEFDENAEPAWTGPAEIQTAFISTPEDKDPDGGIVISCAVGEGETWLDALEDQYPDTWDALVSRPEMGERYEISDYLDITVPADCEAEKYILAGAWTE